MPRYFLHSCSKIQARREKDLTSEMRLNSAKNVRLKKRDVYLQLLPTRPRLTLLCTQPFLLVVFPAPQSTSFQTWSASACLISCRFLCFFLIFSLWSRYLTAVRFAHGWHDYCVNPPQYVIYRPLCLIRECPAVASLEFYFHFFYRIFLRKRKLSSAYWWKSPNYAM